MEASTQQAASQDNWQVYPQLSKEQFELARAQSVEPVQAQILTNRGISDPARMRAFLDASYEQSLDPYRIIDMEKAVERIRSALNSGEHITVYGDFDADGVTSSALLFRALRRLKRTDAPLDYHIPHRINDGCGLNYRALDMLKARGTSLVVTTDCASSDAVQVAYARSLGIDVIITDHHHPPAILPQAYAMVNPWRPEQPEQPAYLSDVRGLCGVGIAFKLTQALYRLYALPREEEYNLLDLVAIGTVADVAPLLGENHMLVRLGLQQLNNTSKPGLRALIRNANLQMGRIRERDIAFSLAPRLNAAGRMQDASIAFNLLVTDSEEEAMAYANQLEALNLARQQQTEELMRDVRAQAQSQSNARVVLVMGDDWHEGIIGLVAGRLSEEVDKPVLVLSNDKATRLSRGSARSRKGYNIIAALSDFAHNLERYGGHTQAAGFTIQSERIEDLRRHLLSWQERAPSPALTSSNGDTTTAVDETESIAKIAQEPVKKMVDLTLTRWNKLNYELYQQVRQLAPFGAGNPEPIFKMERLHLYHARLSGKESQHVQFWLGAPHSPQHVQSLANEQRRQGTLFKGAARLKDFTGISTVTIIFQLEGSQDESKQEVWLRILDIFPDAEAASVG